jgi:sugar lactone lactonase YvrE
LNLPHSIALDLAGDLYIGDVFNYRVRKVKQDGRITTIAGGGKPVSGNGDHSPASMALLGVVSDIAIDGAGNLFLSEPFTHRVRKVGADNIITTIAGTGEAGFSGDGGPAEAARLNTPGGLAVDAADSLYIVDILNHRVRKVSRDGTITTVAGNGSKAYAGDGGPALQASLGVSHGGLAVDRGGNLYLPDLGNHCIRKVSVEGIISTVAGTGQAGFSGDGDLAINAMLNHPHDVTVDSSGNLFIADWGNHRVRKIDSGGIITSVAGNGNARFSSAQGPATQIGLSGPYSVAIDAKGDLLISHSSFDYASIRPSREFVLKVFAVAAPGLMAGRLFP